MATIPAVTVPLTVEGHVTIEQIRDGRVIDRREGPNLVVTTGLQWLSGALSGDVAAPETMKYIGVGTGTGAAAAGDTTLGTPVESRATGTQSRVTTTVTNDTYQVVGTISITDTRAITEAGLFSASTDGTLGARQVFSAVNAVSGDSVQVTWKLKFS
jgi:hypothetical protein